MMDKCIKLFLYFCTDIWNKNVREYFGPPVFYIHIDVPTNTPFAYIQGNLNENKCYSEVDLSIVQQRSNLLPIYFIRSRQ